jgi:hypothetical protein
MIGCPMGMFIVVTVRVVSVVVQAKIAMVSCPAMRRTSIRYSVASCTDDHRQGTDVE